MIKVVFLLWYPPLLCLVNSWNAMEIFCHAKCSSINMIHFLCSGFPTLCCQSTESGFKTFLVDVISQVISKLVCVWLYLGAWETATDVFFLNPLAIHIVYELIGTKAPIWSTSVPFTWSAGTEGGDLHILAVLFPELGCEWCMPGAVVYIAWTQWGNALSMGKWCMLWLCPCARKFFFPGKVTPSGECVCFFFLSNYPSALSAALLEALPCLWTFA